VVHVDTRVDIALVSALEARHVSDILGEDIPLFGPQAKYEATVFSF